MAQIRHEKDKKVKKEQENVTEWIDQSFPIKTIAPIREQFIEMIMNTSEASLKRIFDAYQGNNMMLFLDSMI